MVKGLKCAAQIIPYVQLVGPYINEFIACIRVTYSFQNVNSELTKERIIMVHIYILAVVLAAMAPCIKGHGFLAIPGARNSMWRLGFYTPINYDDMGLNCGGASVSTSFFISLTVCCQVACMLVVLFVWYV